VAGGLLAGIDGALTGSRTTEWLGALRPDYAVIACSGIEEKGGVLDFDVGKTDIKRCAMRHARCNILVVDHTKFGRQALIRFADLSEFDVLISDQPVSPEFLPADVSGLDIRIPN
jgi:DeoR family glycerol-3-phosphate regulon repressor